MAIKREEKIEDKPHGMVLFSDGSANPNPGFGGWGLHGYTYSDQLPKKGSGNTTQYLTEKGYIEKIQAKTVKPTEVKPLTYVDGYGSFSQSITNNVAEIAAAANGFAYADGYEIKKLLLLTDSEYTVNGATKWLPTWKSNNWIKRDGSPVANKDIWLTLDANLQKLTDKGVEVEVRWVKGHSTFLGNQIADKNADIGRLYSNRNLLRTEFNTKPAEGYWSSKLEKHPFICQRRIYFSTIKESNVPGEYYLGEHGKDDELLGKRTADGCHSYIQLETPEPFIEMLRTKQCEEAKDLDSIIMGRLDKLFEPSTQADLDRFGEVCIYRAHRSKLDLNFIDNEPLTKELKPPRLAMRAIESVNTLKGIFLAWQDAGNDTITSTNVTPLFYDVDSKGERKLKAQFIVGFSMLSLEVFYGKQTPLQKEKVDLCMGVDMPDRNALKRLEKLKPEITVVTWMESEKTFRYATILKSGNSYGIWAGMHSNLRILI